MQVLWKNRKVWWTILCCILGVFWNCYSNYSMKYPNLYWYKEYKEEGQCAQKWGRMLVFVICGFIKNFSTNSYFILHAGLPRQPRMPRIGPCQVLAATLTLSQPGGGGRLCLPYTGVLGWLKFAVAALLSILWLHIINFPCLKILALFIHHCCMDNFIHLYLWGLLCFDNQRISPWDVLLWPKPNRWVGEGLTEYTEGQ